jgi:hypothetical protein
MSHRITNQVIKRIGPAQVKAFDLEDEEIGGWIVLFTDKSGNDMFATFNTKKQAEDWARNDNPRPRRRNSAKLQEAVRLSNELAGRRGSGRPHHAWEL